MRKQMRAAVSLEASDWPAVPQRSFKNYAVGSIEPQTTKRCSVAILLTIDEVAVALNISKKSVQRRIKSGVIRKAPIGGRLVRISSDELHRLGASNLVQEEPKNPDSNR